MKKYSDCIMEESSCTSCSLVSYGKDCHNNPANKIAYLRARAGLTQTALAKNINVPCRWVQKLESGEIETGNITLSKALLLSEAFGVEPKNLL